MSNQRNHNWFKETFAVSLYQRCVYGTPLRQRKAAVKWWVWSYRTRGLPAVGVFLSQVLSRGKEIRCVCIFIEIARPGDLYEDFWLHFYMFWRCMQRWPITNVCPSNELAVVCDFLGLTCLRFKQYIHICTLHIICILITSNITI